MPDAKSQRDFLLRLTQEKRLEPDVSRIAGRCAVCGRDILQWEIDFGYAAFDVRLFCSGCIRDKDLASQKDKKRCGGEVKKYE